MKRKIKYEKLVRDKVPQLIMKDGNVLKVHQIKKFTKEYIDAIADKIEEEAKELASAYAWYDHVTEVEPGDHTLEHELLIEEFADLFEVLDIVKRQFSISNEDITNARIEKAKDKGTFSEMNFLEWVKK